jgi:hypothetical protein
MPKKRLRAKQARLSHWKRRWRMLSHELNNRESVGHPTQARSLNAVNERRFESTHASGTPGGLAQEFWSHFAVAQRFWGLMQPAC